MVEEENNLREEDDGDRVEELGAAAVLEPLKTRNFMDVSCTAKTSMKFIHVSVRSLG